MRKYDSFGATCVLVLYMIFLLGCAMNSTQQQMATQTYSNSRTIISSPITQASSTTRVKATDELDLIIREVSTYLNSNLPSESKIVILNIESSSSPLSEYIVDELITNAVNDRIFSVVDRRQLKDIQSEQLFQISGAVDDMEALSIGKFFAAQTIVSGIIREIGGQYRLTIRALAVQTAQVQAQQSWNLVNSPMFIALLNSNVGRATESLPTQTTPNTEITTTPTQLPVPVASTIQGISARGNTLADKLLWLNRSVDSHNTYIVEADADETIAPYEFEYRGAVDIIVVLKGDSQNRTIRLGSNETMFTVGENVTLILDNNITLHGHKRDRGSMVKVNPNGTLVMNAGSTIMGNTISSEYEGSGVYLYGGSFTMNGGTITGNTGIKGGGVYISSGSTFTMTGGTISGNIANNGAGVFIDFGTFTMRGGTISGNIAHEYGAGVSSNYHSPGHMIEFSKSDGIITGYSSDQINGNKVMDEEGNILARRGHAVFRREDMRKETTSDAGNRMTNKTDGIAGGWDQ